MLQKRKKCRKYECLATQWILLYIVYFLCLIPMTVYGQGNVTGPLRAEQLLWEIPASIFENTNSPITEEEKAQLLDKGYCSTWVITENTPDRMTIGPMSWSRDLVTVRVFRNEIGGGAFVLTAKSAQGCVSEVWAFNAKGGMVPLDDLPEALPNDYFSQGAALPPEISMTFTLCLESDFIIALPSFWSMAGEVVMCPLNEVFLIWNKNHFKKIIMPAAQDLEALAQKAADAKNAEELYPEAKANGTVTLPITSEEKTLGNEPSQKNVPAESELD